MPAAAGLAKTPAPEGMGAAPRFPLLLLGRIILNLK